MKEKTKKHGISKKNCSNLKQKKERKICIINKKGFTTNTGMKRQKCNMH